MSQTSEEGELYECLNCGRHKFLRDTGEGRCPACYSMGIVVMTQASIDKANRLPWFIRWIKRG